MAELAKKVMHAGGDDLPKTIQTAAQRALFNNLNKNEALALQIDSAVKRVKQVDFRGDERKESIIKFEIFQIVKNEKEVERIFAIIKEQREY